MNEPICSSENPTRPKTLTEKETELIEDKAEAYIADKANKTFKEDLKESTPINLESL